MSLGRSASYEKEAIDRGAMVFGVDADFHAAVLGGDEDEIRRVGRRIKTDESPNGNSSDNAIATWRGTITNFRTLPRHTLVIHWEAHLHRLQWGLTGEGVILDREDVDNWNQPGFVFHRPLEGGWQKNSVGGVPLSDIHPRARPFAINIATLSRVQTDAEYFRALIMDRDTTEWETRPGWAELAAQKGWHPKNRTAILTTRRKQSSSPLVRDTADYFVEEARRMAITAFQTVSYANGQTVLTIVKNKESGFATREELEEEIAALLKGQGNCCALTHHKFVVDELNPHLRPSLDRKDSSRGYVPGNLQVVTRAGNFFKSASDENDWDMKAKAMEKMAIAMQRARKRLASIR